MTGTATPTSTAELTDAQLKQTLMVGLIVGTPFIYVTCTLLALSAGLGNALAIACVPTFFCGWFYGGILPLLKIVDKAERAHAGAIIELSTLLERRDGERTVA